MNFRSGLLLLLFLNALLANAQFQTITTQPASRQQLIQSVAQIYNFEFSQAEVTLSQLGKQHPNHPIVGLLGAVTSYWQWFPACTDARLEASVRNQLAVVSKASSDWLSHDKTNPEAIYAYFSAEALLTRLDNLANAKLASVGHAKNAYPYVRRCADQQQQFPDFRLVAGLYNYYRQEYPQLHPFYKPLVWFMRSGDKEEGIRQLTMAARESLFSKAEAGFYLAHVLTVYEKKPADALPTLQSLVDIYPNNLYLQTKMADIFLSAGRPKEALPYIQKLLTSARPGYRPYGLLDQARYELLTGQLAEAQRGATALLKSTTKNETELAYANQILAQVAMRQGQPAQARHYYKQVIKLAEYPILLDEAEAYLKDPSSGTLISRQ